MTIRIGRSGMVAIAAVAIAGCGSSDTPASLKTQADTSIDIVVPAHVLEPGQSINAVVRMVRTGDTQPVPAERVVWSSTDTTVATIEAGLIVGRGTGTVTIAASVAGRSASADFTVGWKTDAALTITVPADTISIGARFRSVAWLRKTQPVVPADWSSSDSAVATVDSLGIVTPLSAGRVTIRARFGGLIGATSFEVVATSAEHGFGYVYSYDAPSVEQYDGLVAWTPTPSMGYSTALGPVVYLGPPYPTSVDFGWTGLGISAPGAMFHVVPFDLAPCAAYANETLDYIWVVGGAAQVACYDRAGFRSSDRMELVVMSPTAFTGTLAIARPGMPSVMSNGTPIREIDIGGGARDYEVQGLARDSLYWFVSPGKPELGSCSVAPASGTPQSAVARVACRNSVGLAVQPVVNGIGFGSDAARGNFPHGFAEIDAFGQVVRTSTTPGLVFSARRVANQVLDTYEISITGERVAEYGRLPAVFLTPVSSNAPSCLMTATRSSGSQISLRVKCASPVEGLLVGAVY